MSKINFVKLFGVSALSLLLLSGVAGCAGNNETPNDNTKPDVVVPGNESVKELNFEIQKVEEISFNNLVNALKDFVPKITEKQTLSVSNYNEFLENVNNKSDKLFLDVLIEDNEFGYLQKYKINISLEKIKNKLYTEVKGPESYLIKVNEFKNKDELDDFISKAYSLETLDGESLPHNCAFTYDYEKLDLSQVNNNLELPVTFEDTRTGLKTIKNIKFDVTDQKIATFLNGNGQLLWRTIIKDGKAEFKGNLPVKEPEGIYAFEFFGWDIDPNNLTEDTILTPIFERVDNSYTITVVDDDIEYEGQKIVRGEKVSKAIEVFNFKKEGYSFQTLYLDAEFTKPIDLDFVPESDLKLYIKWEELDYTIKYYFPGNKSFEVKKSYTEREDFLKFDPLIKGKRVEGYYKDIKFKEPVTKEDLINIKEIHCKLEDNVYNVEYVLPNDVVETKEYSYSDGNQILTYQAQNEDIFNKYEIIGWSKELNGEAIENLELEPFKNGEKITLYAICKLKEYNFSGIKCVSGMGHGFKLGSIVSSEILDLPKSFNFENYSQLAAKIMEYANQETNRDIYYKIGENLILVDELNDFVNDFNSMAGNETFEMYIPNTLRNVEIVSYDTTTNKFIFTNHIIENGATIPSNLLNFSLSNATYEFENQTAYTTREGKSFTVSYRDNSRETLIEWNKKAFVDGGTEVRIRYAEEFEDLFNKTVVFYNGQKVLLSSLKDELKLLPANNTYQLLKVSQEQIPMKNKNFNLVDQNGNAVNSDTKVTSDLKISAVLKDSLTFFAIPDYNVTENTKKDSIKVIINLDMALNDSVTMEIFKNNIKAEVLKELAKTVIDIKEENLNFINFEILDFLLKTPTDKTNDSLASMVILYK